MARPNDDHPATTVYGLLLHRHAQAVRKNFHGKERADIFDLIERFSALFPEECKVWEDRYSGDGS